MKKKKMTLAILLACSMMAGLGDLPNNVFHSILASSHKLFKSSSTLRIYLY